MVQSGQGRSYMKDTNKVFFDSNILIYFADKRDARKQAIADKLIKSASENENGIISTQSLQEFYNATTKKLLCTPQKAKEYAKNFADSFNVYQIAPEMIFNAIDISIKNQLSFWDSLIISAAEEAGCVIVYSEDLNDGQIINGIKILNPFMAA